MFTEKFAREFIERQHAEYYQRLLQLAEPYALRLPELPTIQIVDSVFVHCGQYNPRENVCQYSLPYCVYDGSGYVNTIAHELCHAFADCINANGAAHGAEFKFLISLALPGCDPDKEVYHNYPIARVMDIAEQLKAARGGVSSTMSFISKRKSITDLRKELQEKQRQ